MQVFASNNVISNENHTDFNNKRKICDIYDDMHGTQIGTCELIEEKPELKRRKMVDHTLPASEIISFSAQKKEQEADIDMIDSKAYNETKPMSDKNNAQLTVAIDKRYVNQMDTDKESFRTLVYTENSTKDEYKTFCQFCFKYE